MQMLRSLPSRLVMLAAAVFFGLGGLAVALPSWHGGWWLLIFAPLIAIVLAFAGVGTAIASRPQEALAVIVVAPVVAFLAYPAMLVARESWPAAGVGFALVGLVAAGLAAVPPAPRGLAGGGQPARTA